MPNRLADATSPYLQQHADNPVDWWPWGPEAFAEAERRGVPVLLSVGYAACHWCHVMAHESFEDDGTAAYLNERFVAVKVDREERPDVDAVYMEAVQAATGQGGWPMTVFLTPGKEPFYFGTYFPPEPRHGMPSFRQVLEGVHAAWRDRREEVGEVAGRIRADLAERASVYAVGSGVHTPPGEAELHEALVGLSRDFDERHGGFGGAPKFPPAMVIEYLLRHHARTGSGAALEMAVRTGEAMARGGIHDQLGGGFSRYAVDARWVVPHFEKMLYDNALLLRAYLHLWRATGSPLARRTVLSTADFLLRELRTPEGAFASALDADSLDEETGASSEGAYYVWEPGQLVDLLGPADAATAARLFSVTAAGTFEHGTSVLQLLADPEDPAEYEAIRARLLAARAERPAPARDDKVVAAWNGLAIAALAETGALLDRPDLVAAAERAADLLLAVHLTSDGRLLRTSRDGRPGANAGVLEDYADTAEGFLALYAVTGEAEWLQLAGGLLDTVLKHFADEATGALYDTADDAEELIRRPQDPTDNATPSGWTAAANALLGYAAYTGSDRHRTAAERALGIVGALAPRAPRFVGWGLAAAEALADGPREVAVIGPAGDPATVALHRTALLGTAPGAVVAFGEPGAGSDDVPLLTGRPLVDGAPAAYVCRHFTCDAPTTDPAVLATRLGVLQDVPEQ
ncbi:thioredoxin domain-containing protein [Kitasatospora purpeofusca]|uniref:thioredoxin domain-containing protein n=1 Tax=Kitasatospora purpeofusca TaxID=67352 RepID=UPI00224F9B5F|nr:thioredoxin domain-containing protein [Kitasatospora purpeofusca]MCX4754626.1 thioredoxin domain-containing protein [Kitasatospora purpeofusca]WSR34034.1 thioredoxin domain-containing protein [Kitasatospora purpeofusca]